MSYKLLYIEDLNPDSIMSDLTDQGFIMEHLNPVGFEDVIKRFINCDFDALLLDFRLSSAKAIFDAPAIAQAVRTMSSKEDKDPQKKITHFPIFLISAEKNISAYYDDITSNDLFDISVAKETFLDNLQKYSARFNSVINAYKKIKELDFDLVKLLDITENGIVIDYRFIEKIKDDHVKHNVYFYSKFIYNQLIRSIGPLIGEDILSARLGIAKGSEGWDNLKEVFQSYKYKGIFSDAYPRWWSLGIEKICLENFKIQSLRRLNAAQRLEVFEAAGFKNLQALKPVDYAESANFWTICSETKNAIDPLDGLELSKKDMLSWQEKEYLSVIAALESSDLLKYVKPSDKIRFNEIKNGIK